jgi:uncharacterized RDD family membrane protein YckC
MDENYRQEDLSKAGSFCSGCGRQIQAAALFCPICGTRVNSEQHSFTESGVSVNPEASETITSQPTVTPPPIPQADTQQASQETDQTIAGIAVRCVGALLDIFIIIVFGFIYAKFTGQTTTDGFELHGLPAFLWWISGIFYYIIFEGKLGATPAKMLLGLRIIKVDGESCDITAASIRTICRLVDHFLFIGIIIMLCSKRKQRLGDQLANTLVIKARG